MMLRASFLCCLSMFCSPCRATEQPNIVYIMLDEWGYFESSAMGHPILETPNIDRLASQGMRFTQFLAGANVCAPTRSTLMTGLHTGHTTVRRNSGGLALRKEDVTVASLLQQAGYATGGFGKWGIGDVGTTGVPEKHGFDLFFGYYHQVHAHSHFPRCLIRNSRRVPLEGNSGSWEGGETFAQYLIHEAGLEFIRQHRNKPFFAYMPWTPPHGLWGIPDDEPAWQKYKNLSWDAKNQRGQHDAQIYAAMIEMIDRQIGDVIQLLRELSIEQNTLIFVCGDNGGQPYFKNEGHPHGFLAPNLDPVTGMRFRGGKGNFYEGGLRIPFIACWPGRIEAGAVSDHLGYFPDIMPTLCELAGIEAPAKIDGLSIVPTLLGEEVAGHAQAQHDYLYWEDAGSLAIRMKNWKAIQPNRNTSLELYDLSVDVQEQNDVSAAHPDLVQRMRSLANQAHSAPRNGQVLDASIGFRRETH